MIQAAELPTARWECLGSVLSISKVGLCIPTAPASTPEPVWGMPSISSRPWSFPSSANHPWPAMNAMSYWLIDRQKPSDMSTRSAVWPREVRAFCAASLKGRNRHAPGRPGLAVQAAHAQIDPDRTTAHGGISEMPFVAAVDPLARHAAPRAPCGSTGSRPGTDRQCRPGSIDRHHPHVRQVR